MSEQAIVRAGRIAAERRMSSSCTITRASGTPTLDPATGELTATTTTVYTGKCHVRPTAIESQARDQGDGRTEVWPFTVSVPWAVTGIRPGDVIDVTSSTDPDAEALTYIVRSVAVGPTVTARRMGCEVNAG